MNEKLRSIVTASLFAAITTIATMLIKVPTFGTNGYVNIGDTIVLIGAWLLGNPYGAFAAGIGSGLADLLSGYPAYIPGTIVVKFAMAFACAASYSGLKKKMPRTVGFLVSSVVAEAIMIAGYFLYEALFLGYGLVAAASVISNAVQGITCLVLGNALIHALEPLFNRFAITHQTP